MEGILHDCVLSIEEYIRVLDLAEEDGEDINSYRIEADGVLESLLEILDFLGHTFEPLFFT